MSNYSKTTDFEAKDSLPTGDSGKIIRGAEFETEFDAISTAIATKADTAGPTFTGTLTFETISDGTISVTAFVDEDNMASDSATLVPTQQSVKAYVDSQVTAQDLDFQADSGGALSIDLDSEALTLTGGTGIDTSGSGNAVTFDIDSTVATLTGTQTLTNKTLTAPTISGNLTTDGTIDGRDVATDGAKLDGIEAGATADQTAAEIRTLVESATDSNVFTDADHTKLDGIEASATADQTDAEIRAAVEAATDSNVFTDADHTKLDGIEASADVTDTANVTAAGALMDSEVTNLAQVKAFDSSDYATAAQGSTADSALQNVVEDTTPQLGGDLASNGNDILFADSDKAIFGASSDLQIYHSSSQSYIEDAGSGNLNFKSNGNNFNFLDGSDNVVMQIDMDSETTLYHNTNAKLATTSTGIDVTGTVVASSGASTFNSDSSANTVNFDGRSSDNIAQLNFRPNGGASNYSQIQSRSTELFVKTIANIPMSFHTNNTERLGIANNGDISFYEDTGTTAKLFWDSSAESLGIGTTSPSSSYAVDATAGYRSSAAIPNFTLVETDASGQTWQINSTGAKLSFRDVSRAADRVVIDTAGNVGIGTDSPSEELEISAAIPTVRLTDTDDSSYANIFYNSPNLILDSDAGNTDGSSNIQLRVDGTEHMRIDSSGDISFYEDTGTTAKLVWKSADERLGIGTSNPSYPLTVHDTGDGIKFEVSDTVDANYRIQVSGSDIVTGPSTSSAYTFQTGNTERMRIDSSGNVGIGTDDPSADLHIEGSAPYLRTKNTSAPTDEKTWDYNAGTDGTFRFRATNDAGNDSNNWMVVDRSGVNINYIALSTGNQSEAMRLDSSGNLLIGTTDNSPVGNNVAGGIGLFPNGSGQFSRDGGQPLLLNRKTSDGTIADFRKNGSTVGSIGTLNSALTIGTGDTGVQFNQDTNAIMPHNITTGANVDASIDIGYSSGGTNRRFKDLYLSGTAHTNQLRLKDGTATTGGLFHEKDVIGSGTSTNPSFFAETGKSINFMVNGSVTKAAILDTSGNLLVGTTSTTADEGGIVARPDSDVSNIYIGHATGTAGGNPYIRFRYGSGNIGSITQSGTTAVLYNTSSDQRLKENIVDAPSASDDIDAIQVRSFDWKVDGSHQKYGMIAQELLESAPEVVHQPENSEDMMGVDYSKLVPMLVKEIQSLRARVAQLEGEA